MNVPEPILLFVYGSLKRGCALHHHLRGARFIGTAQTAPLYRLLDCGEYPALVEPAAGGRSVHGELFQVNRATLQWLDVVEAVDEGLYERDAVSLAGPYDKDDVIAYFYLRSVAGLPDCGSSWP